MNPVSKMRWKQFVQQARGAKVFEIHVNRVDKKAKVVLQYNGKAAKQKNRLTGQWQITRGEKDDAAIEGEINEFLTMARKDFFVHRGEGLGGEKFADAKMEAKGVPIKGEGEGQEASA